MLRTTREPFTAGHAAPRRPSAGQRWAVPRVGQRFVLQGLPACLPGPRPWPARSIQMRRDAHGLVGLWIRATC